jgi:hypothetical protein
MGNIMGIISDEYLKKRIGEISEEFLEMKKLLEPGPAFDMRKIKRLVTSIDRLQTTLDDLPPLESSWLGKREVVEDERNNPVKWLSEDYLEDLRILENCLNNIKSRADRALEFLTGSKGRGSKDLALEYFIKRMALLWEGSKGKKPSKTYPTDSGSKNDFLDWVYEMLENLGHLHLSKESLAKHFQRTLPK